MSVLPLRNSTTTTVLRPKALARVRTKKEKSKRTCRERAIRASKEEEGLENSRGRDALPAAVGASSCWQNIGAAIA